MGWPVKLVGPFSLKGENMTPLEKELLRVALAISDCLKVAKPREAILMPEHRWKQVERLAHRYELARTHGWQHTADQSLHHLRLAWRSLHEELVQLSTGLELDSVPVTASCSEIWGDNKHT